MKKLELQKSNKLDVKTIEVIDITIKSQPKHIASIYVDGEIIFMQAIYSQDLTQIKTIADNFNLFFVKIFMIDFYSPSHQFILVFKKIFIFLKFLLN